MAITFDAKSKGATTTAGTSLTVSHTVGSGNQNYVLIVGVVATASSGSAADPSGITYNGSAMTMIKDQACSSLRQKGSIWYINAPTAGTHNIVASYAANHCIGIIAASFYNVKQSSGLDTSSAKAVDIFTYSTSLSAAETNELVLAMAGSRNSLAATAWLDTSSQTAIDQEQYEDVSECLVMAYKIAGSGTVTSTWTASYDTGEIVQVAFKYLAPSTNIKTFNGLAYASTKTVNGVAIASVKTYNGLS